jgi:hypothetical protein
LAETHESFRQLDLPQVLRLLDRHFGELTYSLRSLFRDEQRRIVNVLMESAENEAAGLYRQIHERHEPKMRLLSLLSLPVPPAFRAAAEFVLNLDLREALGQPVLDAAAVRALLDEAKNHQVQLDEAGLGFTFGLTLERVAARLVEAPEESGRIEALLQAAELARDVPFEVLLWRSQNQFFNVLRARYPEVAQRADAGEEEARCWVERFRAAGEALWVAVD